MSEHIPESPPKPKGLEAKLTKKVIGPVPLWLVIGVAGGVVLLLIRRARGGATSPVPTDTAASGAPVDTTGAAGGDPGAGGVGSIDGGPTGNVGGVEDPVPGGGTSSDFFWPDNSPGVSANPPSYDPVASDPTDPSAGMIPMFGGWYSPGWENPDVQANLVAIGTEYAKTHPGWADNASPGVGKAPVSKPGTSIGGWELVSASGGGSRRLSALVSPASSPAGRIAAVTTPYSVGPSGTVVHVSSVAALPGGTQFRSGQNIME